MPCETRVQSTRDEPLRFPPQEENEESLALRVFLSGRDTLLFYESCYGIGMNLLLEEKGKGRGHEACVPCFVPFHATFLGVKGDSLISF